MKNPDGLMKIGDFARTAETNLRTLRYYEELELLKPSMRSAGGFRYYRTVDLHRVRTIQSLQENGLSLEEIGKILARRKENETRKALMARVSHSLEQQADLIAERLEHLNIQSAAITEALEKVDSCADCQHTPSTENNWCEPCKRTERSLPSSLSALF